MKKGSDTPHTPPSPPVDSWAHALYVPKGPRRRFRHILQAHCQMDKTIRHGDLEPENAEGEGTYRVFSLLTQCIGQLGKISCHVLSMVRRSECLGSFVVLSLPAIAIFFSSYRVLPAEFEFYWLRIASFVRLPASFDPTVHVAPL